MYDHLKHWDRQPWGRRRGGEEEEERNRGGGEGLTHGLEELLVVLLGVHLPCSAEGHVLGVPLHRETGDDWEKISTKWRAPPRGRASYSGGPGARGPG